ncbi:THAP domain-containing protein 2 [Merluccius polli]|uniref:THAP domain-containing protein 2 n=1 Tax=Merluccius polli TaxID=89951 RepID=A0AA47M741_MERPO|nr:THAP domain-containing protein 2 [Merluccius polli]
MSAFTIKERRLTFQRVRTSALHCCVPQCTNSSRYNKMISFHSFPVDPAVRAEWLRRIRRDNFSPTKNTRVCGRHFKNTDFVVTAGGFRRLQKGSVPVLFSWNGFELPAPRPSVWERRPRPESPDVSDNEMEIAGVATDHDYTGIRASDLAEDNEALRRRILELEQQIKGLQLQQRFGIHHLTASDDSIRFYTRFASYQHFQAFWSLVEPAVNSKMVRITSSKTASNSSSSSHQTKHELLLFLMYLAVGLPLNDLAERFNIHRSTASRIVSTWTQFLYTLLGSKRLWLPSEVVRAHLPPEFDAFADTQAVFDCTEIHCQTPSSLLLQSEVFSTYKSHATLKAMIGMAPHGAITFVSGLYAGSISDREIFKLSGISKLLKPDMAIMVDKGFRVDYLVPCKVYRPAFLSKNKQMSRENVRQTQSIARLRVHVERCIRRVKENKLFDTEIPLSVCGNIEQLFSVACFLVNYQNGPLVKAWAT